MHKSDTSPAPQPSAVPYPLGSFEEVGRLVDQTSPAHFALAEVRTEVTKANDFCMPPAAMRTIEILAYAAGT
jgi:hypothetical protein